MSSEKDTTDFNTKYASEIAKTKSQYRRAWLISVEGYEGLFRPPTIGEMRVYQDTLKKSFSEDSNVNSFDVYEILATSLFVCGDDFLKQDASCISKVGEQLHIKILRSGDALVKEL